MSNADIRGRFIWHELMTTDPDAASTFYSSVIPWKTQPSGMPSYTLWMSGKVRAGGLMALPDGDTGTPPHWLIYVGTPDVDATAETARRLGGRVLKGASDIPNVGRFAVLSDPQGAAFAVFTPSPGSGDGAAPAGAIGDFTWHELATTDLDAALRFYTELFGWSKGAAHDMGAMGVYQLISHGGQDVGGAYKARDASTPPSWLSYTRVADAARAASAVKAGGGRVLNGPMEVPGGSWIVMALDPQGGAFAVVEAPRAAAAQKKPAAAAATSAPKPAQAAAPAKPSPAPKPALAPAKPAVPATSPAPAATPAAAAKAAPAKAAPAKKAPAARAAPKKKAAAKKTAGKRKAAAKSARRAASRGKRRAAKKAAAGKRRTATRGSAKKRSAKRGVSRTARGKSRKHR